MGSALGLVGPVSVYCDWVRWKVWSAASISVWQHVKLSVQIRPWDTLACCWDDKQPTNKTKHSYLPSVSIYRSCQYALGSATRNPKPGVEVKLLTVAIDIRRERESKSLQHCVHCVWFGEIPVKIPVRRRGGGGGGGEISSLRRIRKKLEGQRKGGGG